MKNTIAIFIVAISTLFILADATTLPGQEKSTPPRWSKEQANAWGRQQPWLVGCNFIPSTAINQLEMWQEDTFDPATIDRELGWAAKIGMNTVRVFLHDLAWEADPKGFKQRLDKFLHIADRHGIRPLVVLFDDCWNQEPKLGKQPVPRPGVHNSGWVQSPGTKCVLDRQRWGRLEKYVGDVVGSFGQDKRILMWDLYNEPGNNNLGAKSLPFLQATFAWARQAKPTQPLTVGPWHDVQVLNDYELSASDVITFHHYGDAKSLRTRIAELRQLGRPVICTEWMARTHGSKVASHLPIFYEEKIGCYIWGLVSGKTQTIYPWGSKPDSPEPQIWFHDLFRRDGTPFAAAEIALFRQLTAKANKKGQ